MAHTNISNADVDAVAQTVGTTIAWDRIREPNVGGLSEISNPATGAVRWSAGPRTAGHRLDDVHTLGTPSIVTHDNMGNVTASVGFEHEYDVFGRLYRTVDRASGLPLETYHYNAFDQLVAIEYGINNGDIDILHWDGDQMIAATDFITDAPLWDAVFSPTHQDKLLEFYDYTTQQRHLPLTDHRNSVVGAWNATLGQMGELARYDAEGLLTRLSSAEEIECDEHDTAVCAPPNDIPFAFNSLFRSPTTGLVYMRNRWYAPRLGQFISHDPLEYVDSSNLYAFASFDPINNWDPFGLDDENLADPCATGRVPCANAGEEPDERGASVTPEKEHDEPWTPAEAFGVGLAYGVVEDVNQTVDDTAEVVTAVVKEPVKTAKRAARNTVVALEQGLDAIASEGLSEATKDINPMYGLFTNAHAALNARTPAEAGRRTQKVIRQVLIVAGLARAATSVGLGKLGGKWGKGAARGAKPPGVSGVPRVGSALKADPHHAFPDVVDNFARDAIRFEIPTRGPGGAVV